MNEANTARFVSKYPIWIAGSAVFLISNEDEYENT